MITAQHYGQYLDKTHTHTHTHDELNYAQPTVTQYHSSDLH